jgi:hypothetical protein
MSSYGKPYTYQAPPVNPNPGFSMTDAPEKVINAMDTSTYFNMMAELMGEAAPPTPEDAPMLARMAKIGLVPGQTFDMSKLDPVVQEALKDINKLAMKGIEENRNSLGVGYTATFAATVVSLFFVATTAGRLLGGVVGGSIGRATRDDCDLHSVCARNVGVVGRVTPPSHSRRTFSRAVSAPAPSGCRIRWS